MKKILSLIFIFSVTNAVAQEDSLAKDLAEVVVTGQYQPQSVKQSVYQVRSIQRKTIEASGATNLQQVLQSQAGFRFFQDNALGVSDVELMGMGGRNVKILLDGVPLVDRGDMRESLSQIDVNQVERIEIIEGPLSVIYGSDALAGVINIVTRKPSSRTLDISAGMQEETVGEEYYPVHYRGMHQQYLQVATGRGAFSLSAGLTRNAFSGSGGDAYGRDKSWLPREQWLGFGKLGFRKNRFQGYYRLDMLDELIKDRGPINMNNYRALDRRFYAVRYMHQLQSEWSFHNHLRWSSVLSYTDYQRRTKTTRHDFQSGSDELTPGEGEQDLSEVKSFLTRQSMVWRLSPALVIQPGLEFQHEKASGDRISGTPAFSEYAFFATGEIDVTEWLQLRPGFRVIHHTIYDAPPVIPSVNARIAAGRKTVVRAAWSRGFRSPSLRELYFDFRDANHLIIGNKELEAEQSNSYSASIAQDWKIDRAPLQSSLNLFYNQFRNLITYAQHPSDPQVFTLMNLEKFRTIGLTLENSLRLPQLEARIGFSYLGRYNIYSDDEKFATQDLPLYSWTPEFNTNLVYDWRKPGVRFSFFYKFSGKRPGYQVRVNAQTSEEEAYQVITDAFHWTDVFARKTFFQRLDLQVGVKNLFDIKNVNRTGGAGSAHTQEGVQAVGYGRSWVAALHFQLRK
jgi:outer membrane receptor for ferrienterochelin and colicins